MHFASTLIYALRNLVVPLHGTVGPLFSLRSNPGQCPNVSLFDGTIGTGSRRSEVPATTYFAGVLETFFGEAYFVSLILLPNGVLFELRGF